MITAFQWITTTLSLRSEEDTNLSYVVEIEEDGKIYRCFSTENYYQALLVARRVFNRLQTRPSIGNFGVMIEEPQGRGASYDINTFTYEPDFHDSSDFYSDLVNELEFKSLTGKSTNTLFREAVNRHKLNEYQEQRFLQQLRKCRSEKRSSE